MPPLREVVNPKDVRMKKAEHALRAKYLAIFRDREKSL
jgi:hypothetical protein